MKRTTSELYHDSMSTTSSRCQTDITREFINQCRTDFNSNPENIFKRNAIVATGSLMPATDSNEARKVTHIFLNSIKKKDLKATNQGMSGRCWMFAGLNIFRHGLINALDLDSFEFSETYLFFWDKLERSNCFLEYFIENFPKTDSKEFDWQMEHCLTDGGFWMDFAQLVDKYGVVPISAMPETYQSDWSEDMNMAIQNRLKARVSEFYSVKGRDTEKLRNMKKETLQQIYDILVKYLGEPPQNFSWFFERDDVDHSTNAIGDITPDKFKDMVMQESSLVDDFVVLSNVPNKEYYNMYEISNTSQIQGGKNTTVLNVPSHELRKYTKKSVLSGIPVWFACDVFKGFHPLYSALNDKLTDDSLLFGEYGKGFTKEKKMEFRVLEGTHAMCFVGVNIDKAGCPEEWQVENSWGYYDNRTPGLDGFLSMSDEWFENNVTQVVVHKKLLTRTLSRVLTKTPCKVEPWHFFSSVLRVSNIKPPSNIWKGGRKLIDKQ